MNNEYQSVTSEFMGKTFQAAQLTHDTGSSCLMRISLQRISLLRFFKTITKIWLMRFFGLKILLLRT